MPRAQRGPERSTSRDPLVAVVRDLMARLRTGAMGGSRVMALVLVVLFGGAGLFATYEHVSYFRALYWAVTTASTVGYGDVLPTNLAGRLVAIGMMVLAVPLLGVVLANIASTLVEGRLRSVLGMSGQPLPQGYTLVLQWSASAQAATRDLLRRGRAVVVVADDDRLGLEDAGLRFIHGDPVDEQLLGSLHPEQAAAALLCHEHDGDLLVAAIALHRLAPDLPLMAAPARASTAHALRELGIAVGFPSAEFLGYMLARSSESPHAGELLWQLVADDGYAVRERPVRPEEAGRSLAEARAALATASEVVLGVLAGGEVRFGPPETALRAGDRLLVLAARQ